MAGPDFYRILGISPSASLDEIKSAYRELVKKYHPDLFSTSAEKARANEKFLQINGAYAVLGDPARRREYDQKRSPKTTIPKTAATTTKRHRSSPRRSTSAPRSSRSAQKRAPRRKSWRHQFPLKRAASVVFALNSRKSGVHRKSSASILALIAIVAIGYALWETPKAATAWTLLAETVVEPSQSASRQKLAGPNWTPSGSYTSRPQCVAALMEMVKRDKQEGSRAIVDESQGTIAITVQVKDEAALAQEYFEAKLKRIFSPGAGEATVNDQELLKQEAREEAKEFIKRNGPTKRVRNYECRPTQVLQPGSWLRRKFKQAGLVS